MSRVNRQIQGQRAWLTLSPSYGLQTTLWLRYVGVAEHEPVSFCDFLVEGIETVFKSGQTYWQRGEGTKEHIHLSPHNGALTWGAPPADAPPDRPQVEPLPFEQGEIDAT